MVGLSIQDSLFHGILILHPCKYRSQALDITQTHLRTDPDVIGILSLSTDNPQALDNPYSACICRPTCDLRPTQYPIYRSFSVGHLKEYSIGAREVGQILSWYPPQPSNKIIDIPYVSLGLGVQVTDGVVPLPWRHCLNLTMPCHMLYKIYHLFEGKGDTSFELQLHSGTIHNTP